MDTGSGSLHDNCGDPGEVCTTERYVANVNAAGLCGHNDWRMPTQAELSTIADLALTGTAIDPHYLAPTTVGGAYWSSSPYAGNASGAWYLSFDDGHDGANGRGSSYRVRLVRGGQ